MVNKKYYLTGGIGSGETSEGFGPNYSLRNEAYCESCSSCGLVFFQYKLNLAYHDAKYADLYEQTMYNALLGGVALDGKSFCYTNPAGQYGARPVARLPLLRRQHLAHAADDSDLDLREGQCRPLRQHVRRQPHPRRAGRRHRRRDGAEDRLPVEWRDRASPSIRSRPRPSRSTCAFPNRTTSKLYHGLARRQRREALRRQRQASHTRPSRKAMP